jgi:hypothetical protein
MRPSVRDVKVQTTEDRVKASVLFDVHGKDMTLELEERLGAANGYLRFEPLSGQIGSLPIPQSTLESAVQKLLDSPENRDELKLPSDIADLRIENGNWSRPTAEAVGPQARVFRVIVVAQKIHSTVQIRSDSRTSTKAATVDVR